MKAHGFTYFLAISSIFLWPILVSAAAVDKIQICHIPPDDPLNTHIIEVSPQAAAKHISQHGDLNLTAGQTEGPTGSAICSDGIDNDCDGLVDNADPGCQRQYKLAFVTSTIYDGNLGGLQGGDEKCTQVAQASGNSQLSGSTFTAWLSDSNTDAIDRVPLGSHQYRLVNGTIIFDLGVTPPYLPSSPINIAENGNLVDPGNLRSWTGTNANGQLSTLNIQSTCSDWSSNIIGKGVFGANDRVDHAWTELGSTSCDSMFRLYCFEN